MTTTTTITSGMTFTASESTSRLASRTEVSGSFITAAVIAPMPVATAATSGKPGRWDMATPPAVPMKLPLTQHLPSPYL